MRENATPCLILKKVDSQTYKKMYYLHTEIQEKYFEDLPKECEVIFVTIAITISRLYGRYYLPLLATIGDNSVVARTSIHRLPVNGLYAASRSLPPRPPANPATNSKITVRTAQHIPVSQQSREVHSFTIRGSSNQVIRKMHALSTIPLTGNAHFSPIALTNTYSRNPPFRTATGMKHSHTIRDFSILFIITHLLISLNTCFGNQCRTISDNFGWPPRFRTAACVPRQCPLPSTITG